MGYVDLGVAGRTELRIHGVSGTPPESSLDHPHVRRITGDRYAGTYRRLWETSGHASDTSQEHLEAYSWGGLTSGNWRRALWLLLLPFMLLNVAYFMAPRAPADRTAPEPSAARWLRWLSEGAQRVLAISLTVTMTLTAVTIAMDLAAWQCSRDSARCTGRWGPALLEQPTLHDPGPRLVAGAAFPVLVILLLWWQGHKTWRLAESVEASPATAHPETWASPLEDRAMWNGQVPVARLRALHITAALSTVVVFLSAPFLARPRQPVTHLFDGWGTEGRDTPAVIAAVALALLATCLVLTALPRYDRPRPGSPEEAGPNQRVPERALTGLAGGLLVVAGVTAWHLDPGGQLVHPVPASAPRATADLALSGQLPWLNDITVITFFVQLGTLAVLAGCVWRQRRGWPDDKSRQTPLPKEGGDDPAPDEPTIAWNGWAQLIFATLAWVMLGGLAAAFIWRSAAAFGNPQGEGRTAGPNDATPLYLGWQFFWAALAALALAVVLALAGVTAYLRLRAARARAMGQVRFAYADVLADIEPATTDPKGLETLARATGIATTWANAQVERVLNKTLTLLMLGIGGIVVVGAVAAPITYATARDWPLTDRPRQFVTAGGVVLTVAVAGLLWVGKQAYSNPQFRRTVGILWDLGTFWPRATHPLAPPCYCERAIPDLLRRIEYIHGRGGQTVVSAHSQGTVIAAAVIAQMRTPCARNVALVTYGSPLRRLYAQYFPAYFSVRALLRVGELLEPAGTSLGNAWERQRRGSWPWLNIYRRSDPIGGQMFVDYGATESKGLLIDHWGDAQPAGIDGLPLADQLARIRARREVLLAGGTQAVPQTFENGDVDWQLVDPKFARVNGDGVWPHADGHSSYPADPAFPYAVAVVSERRGRYVDEDTP